MDGTNLTTTGEMSLCHSPRIVSSSGTVSTVHLRSSFLTDIVPVSSPTGLEGDV